MWLKYQDGVEGEVDVGHLIGKGVFKALDSGISFNSVFINQANGAIAWSEELEIDPYSAYKKIQELSIKSASNAAD